MITWKHPEQLTKTSIETHPVNLPFLGGRVEVEHTDTATGARLERPLIHLHAEAVDCDWRITLQGDAGTQADATLMPQNVRAMDKDFCLVFADGRRFELLTQKREPIADAAQAAREMRLASINKGRGGEAAQPHPGAVCRVCGWKHTGDFTRWENPHTETVTLIGAGTLARTFLEGLHAGMMRDGRDVATAAAMGNKKSKAPRTADIMGDKESVLFQSTGRGRGKIRPPDPGKAKKPRPKR
jgi:hypothetical protein